MNNESRCCNRSCSCHIRSSRRHLCVEEPAQAEAGRRTDRRRIARRRLGSVAGESHAQFAFRNDLLRSFDDHGADHGLSLSARRRAVRNNDVACRRLRIRRRHRSRGRVHQTGPGERTFANLTHDRARTINPSPHRHARTVFVFSTVLTNRESFTNLRIDAVPTYDRMSRDLILY